MSNYSYRELSPTAAIADSFSEAAQRASISGGFAIVKTALTSMQQETRYEALAALALDALERIEQEWLTNGHKG